jgi:hypothetical protein
MYVICNKKTEIAPETTFMNPRAVGAIQIRDPHAWIHPSAYLYLFLLNSMYMYGMDKIVGI